MPEIQVPIIRGDKIKDDTDYFDAMPVNLIAVLREVLGTNGSLYSHDGLTQQATGRGIDRAGFYNERMHRHFRVSGQRLIELTESGITTLGNISGSDLATMACSFNTQLVVANLSAYLYNGTTLSKITDPDIGAPISAAWIDGYYVFTDGEYIYHTDISNESSIDPLKFATSEISPDKTLAVGRTQDNLLIVFNRYTTEYFINQANEQFAFSRLNQKAIDAGIVGTHAWCELDGYTFILGGRKNERPSVHIIGTGQIVNVSSRSVDKIIASYLEDDLVGVKMECRISERDKLLYLHLPDMVLVYNHGIAEKMGAENSWSILSTGHDEWRAINGVFDPNLNKWIYGDKVDSRIGYLDTTSAAQYGEPVHSEFYSPLIPLESASIDWLEINTIGGFGANGLNFFVSTTRDGASYSQEWSKEAAVPLDYDHRYIVRRLGYVRNRIGFKFRSYHKDKINVGGLKVSYG